MLYCQRLTLVQSPCDDRRCGRAGLSEELLDITVRSPAARAAIAFTHAGCAVCGLLVHRLTETHLSRTARTERLSGEISKATREAETTSGEQQRQLLRKESLGL